MLEGSDRSSAGGPRLFAHRPKAGIDGLGVHDKSHTASIGVIVHLLLPVVRILPDLVTADGQHPFFRARPMMLSFMTASHIWGNSVIISILIVKQSF